jgi:hypothetical protein
VALKWEKSDQREWFIRCSKCSKEQFLTLDDSLDRERGMFVCKFCRRELSRLDRSIGRWVNRFSDREWHGYHISLLDAPWVTAEEILRYEKEKGPEYLHNFVLGLPYVGSGNKVLQNDILGCLSNRINSQGGRVVIGVDTGAKIHYVVGNREGLFYWGEASDYSEIEALLKRYPKSIAVFDQGGDLIWPRQLREKYPGRVFLCFYRQDRKTMELIKWGEKDESGAVIVDRNRMIDLLIGEFKDRRMVLQGVENDWYDYWLHWNAIYRIVEEDALGTLRKRWERNGADHLVHATLYWRVGMDRFGAAEDGAVIGAGSLLDGLPRAPAIEGRETPVKELQEVLKSRKGSWYDGG